MIRIVSDSASDITREEAVAYGIDIVQLDIEFEDGYCPQESAADFQRFYERLRGCDKLPQTSRPSPVQYLEIFDAAKSRGEDVLVLSMSGGLSSTIESAQLGREMADYDRIHIVDTHQAIIAQRMLVECAVRMRDRGMSAAAIAAQIEDLRDDIVVCGVVDTLRYLKKGGRVPASLAVLGEALNIKPVIALEDRILHSIGKVRGRKAGVQLLYKRMEQDGFDPAAPVYFGYTSNREIVADFMAATMEKYAIPDGRLYPIGGIIGTHCGTDCIAVAYFKKNRKVQDLYLD